VRPGGTVVLAGATSGPEPTRTELNRIFYQQITVAGSTMGTRDELRRLIALLVTSGARPVVDSVIGLDDVGAGLRRMIDGALFGKIVVRP